MPYTIEQHKHRLAAWAASRAASVNGCRFKVQHGAEILESIGFDASFDNATKLPAPMCIDGKHREWRENVVEEAKRRHLPFSHGVAAKLINCYLKVRFVCGGHHEDECVRALHPPIDELLLKELAARNVGGFRKEWAKCRYARWSKFDSVTYEDVIAHIRKSLPSGAPLWMIEEYWQGYQ